MDYQASGHAQGYLMDDAIQKSGLYPILRAFGEGPR